MWHDTALLSSCTCLLPWGLVSLLAPSHPCPGLPSSSPAPDGRHSGRTLAKADVFIFRRQNVVLLQMAVPRSKWQPLTLLPRSLGILTDRAGSLLVMGKLEKKTSWNSWIKSQRCFLGEAGYLETDQWKLEGQAATEAAEMLGYLEGRWNQIKARHFEVKSSRGANLKVLCRAQLNERDGIWMAGDRSHLEEDLCLTVMFNIPLQGKTVAINVKVREQLLLPKYCQQDRKCERCCE